MSFSDNEQIRKILRLIIDSGMQFDAISVLLQSLEEEFKEATADRADYMASLLAIRKINNGKNEAIDALCETR